MSNKRFQGGVIAVAAIFVGGCMHVPLTNNQNVGDAMASSTDATSTPSEDAAMMQNAASRPVMEKEQEVMEKIDPAAPISYQGVVLAGNQSVLLDFVQSDYDAAIKAGKNIVLYFYANWCPNCKVEFPVMQAAFSELADPTVVGFRVNFNDTQTDDAERALARLFGVTYQHTKVFVKDGKRILKAPDVWDAERYMAEIEKQF